MIKKWPGSLRVETKLRSLIYNSAFGDVQSMLRRSNTITQLLLSKKTGWLGAVCLIFNAATGPGLPFTPANFSNPGLVPTILMFGVFTLISGFCALFIIEALQAIPGNAHFQGDVEYATLINFYFDPITHVIGQMFLYCALVSNLIQSFVLSAQAVDFLLVDIAGRTCGVSFALQWLCVAHSDTVEIALHSPFGDLYMIFTLGFLVVLCICIPLSLVNLDDNMWVQYASFALSIFIAAQWSSSSSDLVLSRIPIATNLHDNYQLYGTVGGTVMLNLAVSYVIPSWINLKAKEVNAQKTVWLSLGLISTVFIFTGIILSLGFEATTDNILPILQQKGIPRTLTKITVYAFSFVMLIPSIPVNMIISKENLTQNKVVGPRIAFCISYILPILICIPLQNGLWLLPFQTWTSILFVSTANFIIPVIIYFKCLFFRRGYNENRSILILTQFFPQSRLNSCMRSIIGQARLINSLIGKQIIRRISGSLMQQLRQIQYPQSTPHHRLALSFIPRRT